MQQHGQGPWGMSITQFPLLSRQVGAADTATGDGDALRGTELLSAEFLLSTHISQNTKARCIVPLIFALQSGRGAKHRGVWLQQTLLLSTRSGFSQPEAAVYQIVSDIRVLRRALPAR